MKSIHKSQTFIQMSKFVQSCLNFSKILQTFKLQPFFFQLSKFTSGNCSKRRTEKSCESYCRRRYRLTRTPLLWFCGSPWIFIQLNNFFKLLALGIEPLTLAIQVQCSPPTPQGIPVLRAYCPNMYMYCCFGREPHFCPDLPLGFLTSFVQLLNPIPLRKSASQSLDRVRG